MKYSGASGLCRKKVCECQDCESNKLENIELVRVELSGGYGNAKNY